MILSSCDDGVGTVGAALLSSALSFLNLKVLSVLPECNHSGQGGAISFPLAPGVCTFSKVNGDVNALTFRAPFFLDGIRALFLDNEALFSNVEFALFGVNFGCNRSRDITHSANIAAAHYLVGKGISSAVISGSQEHFSVGKTNYLKSFVHHAIIHFITTKEPEPQYVYIYNYAGNMQTEWFESENTFFRFKHQIESGTYD